MRQTDSAGDVGARPTYRDTDTWEVRGFCDPRAASAQSSRELGAFDAAHADHVEGSHRSREIHAISQMCS